MDEGYDAINIARALDLAAGRPLDPLPPEAFELRRDPGAGRRPSTTDAGRSTTRRRRTSHPDGHVASLTACSRIVAPSPACPCASSSASPPSCDRRGPAVRRPRRRAGTWDADQGHDMLVLRALTQLGELPLLGPPTSIGDVHHGVLYYYLLAPAAWLSGSDPVAVTAMIALCGVAAVGGDVVARPLDRRAGRRRSWRAC